MPTVPHNMCRHHVNTGLKSSRNMQFNQVTTPTHTMGTFLDADFPLVALPDFGAGNGVPDRGEVGVKPLPCPLVREGNAHVVLVRMVKELTH